MMMVKKSLKEVCSGQQGWFGASQISPGLEALEGLVTWPQNQTSRGGLTASVRMAGEAAGCKSIA